MATILAVVVAVVVLGQVQEIIGLHSMPAYGGAESTNWNSYLI